MSYRVQTMRAPQQDHWQVTHATPLLAQMGGRGRVPPSNIAGLAQPFPYAHDWRGRSGAGWTPGPSAPHARMFMEDGLY